MSQSVKNSLSVLELISSLSSSQRDILKAILASGNKQLNQSIVELAVNCLKHSGVSISPKNRSVLLKYKRQLYVLADSKKSKKSKKLIIKCSGSCFVPVLYRICKPLLECSNSRRPPTTLKPPRTQSPPSIVVSPPEPEI